MRSAEEEEGEVKQLKNGSGGHECLNMINGKK